jgi:hypothetical protein
MGFDPLRAAVMGVANIFGFYNWLCWGWGLYFAAFTGQWKKDEEEISWIDDICLWLVPFQTAEKHASNYLRGWIGMTLRGVYLMPMFLLFDPLGEHAISPVWWLGFVGLMQGLIYSANRIGKVWQREGTAWPELLCGMLVGAASGTALLLLHSMYQGG